MKKVLSVLLSVIMLTSVLGAGSISAQAAYNSIPGAYTGYSLGQTFNGTFTNNDYEDYIRLTVPSSGRVTFVFKGNINKSYAEYYLYYPDGTEIKYFSADYNSNLGYTYDDSDYINMVSGTYYLKIYSYNTGTYSLTTYFTSVNESFPESTSSNNNVIGRASAMSLGVGYNRQIAYNGDVDFYSFYASGGVYNLYTKSEQELCYNMYYANGDKVSNCGGYNKENSALGYYEGTASFTLSPGTYYLKLYEYSGYTGNYSFSLSSPHSHSYHVSKTVASTYTKKGYTVYTCSCGDSYKSNYKGYKKLPAPKVPKISSPSKGKIKISWKKTSSASGYQIYYSRQKSFKKVAAKKTVGSKTTSYTGAVYI